LLSITNTNSKPRLRFDQSDDHIYHINKAKTCSKQQMCLFESNPVTEITESDLAMKSNSTSVEMMAAEGAVFVSLTLNPANFNS